MSHLTPRLTSLLHVLMATNFVPSTGGARRRLVTLVRARVKEAPEADQEAAPLARQERKSAD